jgi:hypothetical protein
MYRKRNLLLTLLLMQMFPFITSFIIYEELQSESFRKAKQKPSTELNTRMGDQGYALMIHFLPGKKHNHPLMAFWTEDTLGNYLQTLYVAQSIAKGYFAHGNATSGFWQPGPLRRPAALPYWGHKGASKAPDGLYLPTPENPLPDAITGATPTGAFTLNTRTGSTSQTVFNVFMEINQSWDWNHYWHNNRFPGDEQYKTSSQPAVVYRATIDVTKPDELFLFKPVGHSHWSGADGKLYQGLNTLTTALEIVKEVKVEVRKN